MSKVKIPDGKYCSDCQCDNYCLSLIYRMRKADYYCLKYWNKIKKTYKPLRQELLKCSQCLKDTKLKGK